MRQIAGVTAIACLLAAPLAASAGKDLDIAAPDGVKLRATWWSPGRPAGPGVLLLHMCSSDRKAWSKLGPMLAERGLHALALDYRGMGESAGERGATNAERVRIGREIWPGDVAAALETLRSKLGSADAIVGVAGGSCGVNQAIQVARKSPQVRALALLAGTTDRDGEQFLAANPWLPVLGVAARDDAGAVDMTRWVVGFSGHAGNEFKEYADGGHGTEIFAKHADLEPAIAGWFERHLLRQPVKPAPPSREARGGPSEAVWKSFSQAGGVAAVRAARAAALARGESYPVPPEPTVNALGYEQLNGGHAAQAVELFELNAELHPDSANCFDSLADGYVAAKNPAGAIEASKKTLALLPADPSTDQPGQKAIREATLARLKGLGAP